MGLKVGYFGPKIENKMGPGPKNKIKNKIKIIIMIIKATNKNATRYIKIRYETQLYTK